MPSTNLPIASFKLHLLDLSFDSPADNLACDEALLDELEEGAGAPTLRFWESPVPFIVLGYSNKIDTEVNRAECERLGIPILRRSSGGGTVVQGPGCLNYNLTLPINDDTSTITVTNKFIMERHRAALSALLKQQATIQGCTDLTIGPRKFNGNSQRRKSRALVFHGCLLLNFDLNLIETILAHPSKEPDYRARRSHCDFLININVPAHQVKRTLMDVWSADSPRSAPAQNRITALVTDRYGNRAWNEKF